MNELNKNNDLGKRIIEDYVTCPSCGDTVSLNEDCFCGKVSVLLGLRLW